MAFFSQPNLPPQQYSTPARTTPPSLVRGDTADSNDHRVAHTLTACCRCRLRKTRCDPTLPRCIPCERAGSTCEYLDTTKGQKVSRNYVVSLRDKLRAKQAQLQHYLDADADADPDSAVGDELVEERKRLTSANMVRLSANDSIRFLGPSSGIIMDRLLLEEAKRFSSSQQISDILPELRARRRARMQSIQMTGASRSRKRSYPMLSEGPAKSLPDRNTAERLVEVFLRKDHLFAPAVHRPTFLKDLAAVYDGDTDPYRNFIVNIVVAISLQGLNVDYAGLADGYYLAAMQHLKAVVRHRDIKTLQCLVLLCHLYFLAPLRSSAYFVAGFTTKLCQHLGFTNESTITTSGSNLNPLIIDMRKRLAWLVAGIEEVLAYSMGRPSAFPAGHDMQDIGSPALVDDELITEEGILEGPPSASKQAGFHLSRMSIYEAEISHVLYEKKRKEPRDETHAWYREMEDKITKWHDARPASPESYRERITSWYHQLKIFLYRPSPQVPQPSPNAAKICYESAARVLQYLHEQAESNAGNVSWLFLLSLTTSLNTLLWAISFPEVRAIHSQATVQESAEQAIDILETSAERWPGVGRIAAMYPVLVQACLQSYNHTANTEEVPGYFSGWSVPPTIMETGSQSPDAVAPSGAHEANPPTFGNVFDSPPEALNTVKFDPRFPMQPAFRSNSIFEAPSTADPSGRRFSYFPPEAPQAEETGATLAPPGHLHGASPQTFYGQQYQQQPGQRPELPFTSPSHLSAKVASPADTISTGGMSATSSTATFSPVNFHAEGQSLTHSHAGSTHFGPPGSASSPDKPYSEQTMQDANYTLAPANTPQTTQPAPQQRPLPSTDDWYRSTAPFTSSHGLAGMTQQNFLGESLGEQMDPFGGFNFEGGLGLQHMMPDMGGSMNMHATQGDPSLRQESLTLNQQTELMNALKTEGMSDVDTLLNTGDMDYKWV